MRKKKTCERAPKNTEKKLLSAVVCSRLRRARASCRSTAAKKNQLVSQEPRVPDADTMSTKYRRVASSVPVQVRTNNRVETHSCGSTYECTGSCKRRWHMKDTLENLTDPKAITSFRKKLDNLRRNSCQCPEAKKAKTDSTDPQANHPQAKPYVPVALRPGYVPPTSDEEEDDRLDPKKIALWTQRDVRLTTEPIPADVESVAVDQQQEKNRRGVGEHVPLGTHLVVVFTNEFGKSRPLSIIGARSVTGHPDITDRARKLVAEADKEFEEWKSGYTRLKEQFDKFFLKDKASLERFLFDSFPA